MPVPEYPISPLITLASGYGDARMRSWCQPLFAFDAQMAQIVLNAREPMLAQIRMQWWLDVIAKPAGERPLANPLLATLSALERDGLDLPAALGPVLGGWDAALDLDAPGAIAHYAEGRGQLIAAFASLDPHADRADLAHLGRCWAYWDMARCHRPGTPLSGELLAALAPGLPRLAALRLPRRLRPMSMLGRAVVLDIERDEMDRPWNRPGLFAALVWHGLTGR